MAKNNNENAPAQKPAAVTPPAPKAPETPVKVMILLRAVHGTMIHPYEPMDIRCDSLTQVEAIDDWLKCQIDAGKIEVV